ncbi:hypothetical protein FEM48_Zijuj04G0012700 [Ziziphus jujuba var. spinosa]|uniref:4-coumarate--CoA ligase-like 5 n=1 Tax=Ziziphus jujuba var. spinosa TaxID=714518 RepID=A0A978VH02_ZIZJJ|nr:hypothetical protein FEM48_Zijuj04G0012700 [Ziziphus jujuba var. spinosa]
MEQRNSAIDSRNGFNSLTKIFQSLKHPIDLPPEHVPLSVAAFALSLRRNFPWPDSIALIHSASGRTVSYSEFVHRTKTLADNLRTTLGLSKGDTAFILSPNSIQIPILYFSLLTIGVVISPVNPVSTESEIVRLIGLCKPAIAFSTSTNAHKLRNLRLKTILTDSPEFDSISSIPIREREPEPMEAIRQSDLAAILYSSGTTGKVKGVMLTHRNLIFTTAGFYADLTERESPAVLLYTVPYYHIFGFLYCVKSIGVNDTAVVMEKFDLGKMVKAVEEYRVSQLLLVPSVVVAMVKKAHHLKAAGHDLSSLERVRCGAAPLGKDMAMAFKAKFPNAVLSQGYGLTETTGGVFRTDTEESLLRGSTGRLLGSSEAKIVDPETGQGLCPCQQGELWVRGPSIMKGYIGDIDTTSAAIVSGGWLRTGDLCYIDEEGYLYVVDRLKEYPDEEAGQLPMAVVERRPNSNLGEEEVVEFVAKQVAPYKKIRRVAFVESLPKSAAGKILRNELKNMFIAPSLSKL